MISLESVLKFKPQFKGSFVAGRWKLPRQENGGWEAISPANMEWLLPRVAFSFEDVEEAVASARKALPAWRELSLEKRIEAVKRFGDEMAKRKQDIGRMIATETGKPLDESLGEADLLKAKVDVTIEHALPLVAGEKLDLGAAGKAEVVWRPKGVMAVIGPFNFPVHLSNGHIIPALLMGNVCILKPSEKTPYSAQLYAEAAEAAGLPAGVLQMVHGNAESATRLVRHVGVDGVLATCSFEVGAKIQKELAEKPEKIVALEMGGKNAALVWDSSDLDRLANDLIRSAFLSTGQRCTCLSRAYVKRELMDPLLQKFHALAKELIISHPFDDEPKPFMGPLITGASKERFLRYSKIAESEGAEVIMRPKPLEGVPRQSRKPLPVGHYVTPAVSRLGKWDPKSAYQSHEIFGPDIFFCPIDSLEEGVQAVNSTQYGLAFSFFGARREDFDWVADRVEAGLAYWNRPTVGASGRLPFGGWKRSGNHHPAGIFAIYSSVQVQARIMS